MKPKSNDFFFLVNSIFFRCEIFGINEGFKKIKRGSRVRRERKERKVKKKKLVSKSASRNKTKFIYDKFECNLMKNK